MGFFIVAIVVILMVICEAIAAIGWVVITLERDERKRKIPKVIIHRSS